MNMNTVSLALECTKWIPEWAAESKNYSEDCKHLASLARKTDIILVRVEEETEENLSDKPAIRQGVEALLESLHTVEDAIRRCQESSTLVSLIRAPSHNQALKHAATQLSHALVVFPLASIGLTKEIQESVLVSCEELRNLQFDQSALISRKTAELQRAMEFGFNTNTQDSAEIKSKLEELLRTVASSQSICQADIETLKAELATARTNKDRLEEYQLNQIIAALEAHHEADNSKPVADSSADLEIPDHLVCPISKQLMKDPVLVVESCRTYDRLAIEEWFGRGHHTDPMTNVSLSTIQIVPNIAIRKQVASYVAKHPVQSDKGKSSNVTDQSPKSLSPGLKRMSGALSAQNGLFYPIEIIALLEPDGNVQGYSLSEKLFSSDEQCKYLDGQWKGNLLEITFESRDDSDLLTQGAGRTGGLSHKLKGEVMTSIGSLVEASHFSGQWQYYPAGSSQPRGLVDSGTFSFACIQPVLPREHYELEVGLVQVEGGATGDNGYWYPSMLVLTLKPNGSVQGWQTEITTDKFSSEYSIVVSGNWDRHSNRLSFTHFYGSSEELFRSRGTPAYRENLFTYEGMLQETQLRSVYELVTPSPNSGAEASCLVFKGKWYLSQYESYEASSAAVAANEESIANQGSFCFRVFRTLPESGNPLDSDNFHLLKPVAY